MPHEWSRRTGDPTCRRPAWWQRVLEAILGRSPKVLDYGDWTEPPPDIGVREPRRPRPTSGAGSAVLDPPL